jgi:hypothetical protein
MCMCIFLQLEHLPALVTGIWTDDNNMQLEATTQFWKLLSINWLDIVLWTFYFHSFLVYYLLRDIWFNHFHVLPERSPPIEEVIQAGVVPRFIEFLMGKTFHNFK